MKYIQPVGGAVDAPYVDANPGSGIEGSAVPAAAIEHPQREIENVIIGAGIAPAAGDLTQLRQAISKMTVQAGSVIYVAKSTPPTGYLKANGALVSRTTYADLFAAIGTTFGAGDGSTTFNLPDLRGEFIRGVDDGRGVDSGRVLGSAQSATSLNANPVISGVSLPVSNNVLNGEDAVATGTVNVAPSSASTSSTTAFKVRPRNVALLACIKY